MSSLIIRPVDPVEDAAAIAEIYNHYILETVITFETEPLSPQEMEERIRTISARFPYLVCLEHDKLTGYAYANTWRTREAYRHTVETGIYLSPGHTGCGTGRILYEALLDTLRRRGFHAVVAGITVPNVASESLHEKTGFRKVAHFPEVGRKFDRWLDVAFWQIILD